MDAFFVCVARSACLGEEVFLFAESYVGWNIEVTPVAIKEENFCRGEVM